MMKPHPREKPHYVKPTPTASSAIPDAGSRSNSFQHDANTEARSMEAILVFDEAEGLFGRRNAEAASSVDKHLGYWSLPGAISWEVASQYLDVCIIWRFFPKSLRSNTSIGWES